MRIRKAVGVGMVAPVAAVTVLGLCARSRAQVGDGWIPYFPSVALHHSLNGQLYIINPAPNYFDDGHAHYDNDGTVESFVLYDHTSNRIEIRVENNYTSGMRQFEGLVWVDAPTDNESVMQVFGGSTQATAAMFRAFSANGGELRHYSSTSGTIASGIYGTWVQLNVIHDADAGRVYAYVNGQYAGQWADHGPATHYFKYGAYGTHDDAHPAYVSWTSVTFYYQ